MGDLISRSALISLIDEEIRNLEEIKSQTEKEYQGGFMLRLAEANLIKQSIQNMPTAYDLEKVLNELDEKYSRCKIRSRSIFSDNDYRYNDLKRHEKHSSDMQAYAYDTAIDIVKAGGVE